jgi:Spy/CpxP family protein refolding chaperone
VRKLFATIGAAVAVAGAAVAIQAGAATEAPADADWQFYLLPYIEQDNVNRSL